MVRFAVYSEEMRQPSDRLGLSSLKALEESQRQWERLTGPSPMMKMIEESQQRWERLTGPSPMMKMIEESQQRWERLTGPSPMMKMIEESQQRWERLTGPSPMMKAIEESQQRWNSVMARSSFSAMIGARETMADFAARPVFGAMVGIATMPRTQWSDVFEELRQDMGVGLYDEAQRDFDDAAELVGAAEARTWWVERLPVHAQLGLLLLALQVLEQVSNFVGDLTGEDVPPAYRSATQALFALAFVLLALIDARASVADDDEDSLR
jgi:hypothetical protein